MTSHHKHHRGNHQHHRGNNQHLPPPSGRPYPYATPPDYPYPPNDCTTLIAVKGFITGQLAFRRRVTDFPTFDSLLLAAYQLWQNDPAEYRLHLHFDRGRNVQCGQAYLLRKEDWECGMYFIGGRIEVFAHFMEKETGMARGSGGGVRQPVRGGGGYGEKGDVAPPPPRRCQNPDATTAYSLCMPTGRQYFSAPFVFISCPGGAPRVQLFPARDAERWVGFRFLGEGRGGQASSVSGSVDQSIKRGPEAALVEVAPEPARNHLPAAAERQVDENESESDDRMSSPEYGVKEDDEEEQVPSRRDEESLFAPEQYVRRKSVESEGLFVSE